jgi:RND family efflux transporter MFP subunit
VDTLGGQLAVDQAALEAARVARGYGEIRAPFAGRTGIINVRAGSLVQPGGTSPGTPPLVTVTQIDPIAVAFTLPESELGGLQQALAAGPVAATAAPATGGETFSGRITFVDNSVDTASGTIRVKAEFANKELKLWPGMFVTVQVAPRTIRGGTVVPAQAVQTGPEKRFVYVVGPEHKVEAKIVTLAYVEEGFAVVQGIDVDARVVTEGAQNLRPGSVVTEAPAPDAPRLGKGDKKGKKAS